MSRQSWTVLAVVLALLGAAAAFLAHARAHQRLGRPGVKVGPVPTYGVEDQARDTNTVFVISSNSVVLPEKVLDFTSEVVPVPRIVHEWLPKDTTYGQRAYRAPDGFSLYCNVVLMGGDRTSIHQPQYCLTGQGMRIDHTEMTTIPVPRPHPYDLPVVKIIATGQVRAQDGRVREVRAVYVYWFVADNQLTADHAQRMWWMARDLITTGVLQRWAYVACLTYCAPGGEAAAYDRMKQFIAAAVPEFQLAAGPPTRVAAAR